MFCWWFSLHPLSLIQPRFSGSLFEVSGSKQFPRPQIGLVVVWCRSDLFSDIVLLNRVCVSDGKTQGMGFREVIVFEVVTSKNPLTLGVSTFTLVENQDSNKNSACPAKRTILKKR